jgi:hypothetical protein
VYEYELDKIVVAASVPKELATKAKAVPVHPAFADV